MDEDLERFRFHVPKCECCTGKQIGRNQKMYRFPNGYGVSLISAPCSDGSMKWRIFAIRFDNDEYVPDEVQGVENGSTSDWDESMKAVEIIMSLPHF
jgi:hypothetical protein